MSSNGAAKQLLGARFGASLTAAPGTRCRKIKKSREKLDRTQPRNFKLMGPFTLFKMLLRCILGAFYFFYYYFEGYLILRCDYFRK